MTYGWIFHTELATFVDELIGANFVPDRCDILINVMISLKEGLQDVILLSLGIASDLPFCATITFTKLILF